MEFWQASIDRVRHRMVCGRDEAGQPTWHHGLLWP
ncbi:pyridoxine 5'-phosphate oxidase C-terminal domain-containing protein [Streptomyces sp. NPDC102437]